MRSAYLNASTLVLYSLGFTSLRLNKLLGSVIISQGGVVPFINPELLPSKSKKKGGESQEV
jgi:hypothetical protein